MLKAKRPFLTTLILLTIALSGVWLLLRWALGDSVWWLALLNSFPLAWLWLGVPLTLAALLRRRWRLVGLLLGWQLLLFALFYGALFWPNATPPTNGRLLTALTYNILYTNEADAALVTAVLDTDADVVGLQEVTERHAALLSQQLGDAYPYQLFLPPEFRIEVGLLSRYPILSSEELELPPRHQALHAVLDVDGQPVHVFVVHLMPNQLFSRGDQPLAVRVRERFAMRQVETVTLATLIDAIDDPVLLLCDCNLRESSQAYRQLDGRLDEAHGEVGWGLGQTSTFLRWPWPYQRIDYVWYSAAFTAVAVQRTPRGGSDHDGVLATLRLLGKSHKET